METIQLEQAMTLKNNLTCPGYALCVPTSTTAKCQTGLKLLIYEFVLILCVLGKFHACWLHIQHCTDS